MTLKNNSRLQFLKDITGSLLHHRESYSLFYKKQEKIRENIESYILDTINFSGGGSYLSGVMVNDNKTNFLNCKGIQNSAEISQYFMHANTTTTVVTSIGVAYKVLGTTTSSAITLTLTPLSAKEVTNERLPLCEVAPSIPTLL